MKTNIQGLTAEEFDALMKAQGEPAYRARQLFQWVHQKLVTDFEAMTNFSKVQRERFTSLWEVRHLGIEAVEQSKTSPTRKYLFKLPDGEGVESVLMIFENRLSACVSTQAGCAYGCVFCASGLFGLKRNLECWEILDQVYSMQRNATERISNIVFMGTGEPLANYDNTLKTIRLLNNPNGLGIGMRHMTVSTVGNVPMILKLADEGHPIRLAVSLHAPNDELRDKLMPVNKKYKIGELLEACRTYQSKVKRRMTFEYTLIDNVNDSPSLAHQLVNLLRGFRCHVNLIPLNPMDEYKGKAPSRNRVMAFQAILEEARIPVTVREERGQDITAACGQLRRRMMKGA